MTKMLRARIPIVGMIAAPSVAMTVKEGAMVVTRREALAAAVAVGLTLTGTAQDKPPEKPPHFVEKPDMRGQFNWAPYKVAGEPTEESILVASKTFIADSSNPGKSRFRELIDPRYLKKHGLTDRDLAYEIGDITGLHTYHVADDLRTVLFVVDAKGGGRELIVVRWVVYEGHLYISPEKAPDPKTGIFKLWILRAKAI